jgi:hypothetical protein
MKKIFVSYVVIIGALVLLFLSFLGPWYTINTTGILGADYHVGFYLTRMELQRIIGNQEVFLSVDYTDAEMYTQDINVDVESFALIKTAMYLTLLALGTAVTAIGVMTAFILEKVKTRALKLGGVFFSLLTFLITLVIPLYFMTGDFVENTSGFWFSFTALGMNFSGGPGYAWYLMVVVAVLEVLCGVILLFIKIPSRNVADNDITASKE